MRIATLSNASVVHTRRWVEFFRARGHEVGVWSLERDVFGLGAHRLPEAPLPGLLRYPLAVPALVRALADFAPDLVDAHFVPNYGLLGVLARKRPLAVVAWGSDLLVKGGGDPLRSARTRFVLRRADLVVADSENLGAAAVALGAPPARVRVIPWGIDLEHFVPAARRDPGLLLSLRMHEPVYDLPTLFRGVAPVLRARPEARLAIAGVGTLTSELERLAARVLPEGRYQFLGRLDPAAMAEWLGRASVYLSASLSDSTSVTLLEAMASGAVPVVSDLEGNREWVRDGEGARMFTPGDAAGLERALGSALTDSAWADAARAHNRRVVEKRADERRNMGAIETLYAGLAGAAPVAGAGTR